ncbi:UDP-N-acetylglucosamine transporter yea4 [Ophiocordyceps camponoti-floridani]|uniref:UDP-N-acetylglucosamine transporter yea4 n=1 Tax=Ophiocordyceps camponoti-floridani TaxID=2030778 RepID=A0A8H4Q973_9HYPO|nr:UDP-N-acetylglucosamine transporter yea4 [Ophiocordyceps camponoti-floridani]
MEWHDTPVVQSILLEAASFSLIFGGCCSNVYALEAIISFEPSSGTLLTFTQFLFVAVTSYISRFDKTRPPFYLKKAKVPLRRWLVNIVLFFSINLLNNHAFSYSISVPLHIILRSGGAGRNSPEFWNRVGRLVQ